MTRQPLPRFLALILALGGFLVGVPGLAQDYTPSEDSRYGYFSVVEGAATVTQAGERSEVEANYPLMTGDQLWTSHGTRVEAVLSDSSVVRIDGNSVLAFERLAFAADYESDGTRLFLDKGEVLVTVPRDSVGAAQTRIDTPNSTIYFVEPGTYRVESRGYLSTVTVREGSAEVLTQEDSRVVRYGERATVSGMDRPRVQVSYAGGADSLERWSTNLDRLASDYSGTERVDRSLRYASSSLNRHGSWYAESSVSFWRPRVAIDWAPYRDGRWVYTPSGMTWVSAEPWGWVPHHYGSWDRHHQYGWVWYPGRIYRPAWVYWYWSTDRVGWCPTGYYTRYYGRHHYGRSHLDLRFRIGVHGWAGGSHRNYQHWTFVGSDRVYDRHLGRYLRSGRDLQGRHGDGVLPRGLITTDTRGLRPSEVRNPRNAIEVLEHHTDRSGRRARRDLPDISDFVARHDQAPREMVRIAMPVDDRPADSDRSARRSRSSDVPRSRGDGADAVDSKGTTSRSGERSARGADGPRTRSSVSSPRGEDRPATRRVTGGGLEADDRSSARGDRSAVDRRGTSGANVERSTGGNGDRPAVRRVTGGGSQADSASRGSTRPRTPVDSSRDRNPSREEADRPSRIRSVTGGGSTTTSGGDSERRVQPRTPPKSSDDGTSAARSNAPRDRGRATTTPRTPSRDREIVRRVVEGSRPSREGSTGSRDNSTRSRSVAPSDRRTSPPRTVTPPRSSPSSGVRADRPSRSTTASPPSRRETTRSSSPPPRRSSTTTPAPRRRPTATSPSSGSDRGRDRSATSGSSSGSDSRGRTATRSSSGDRSSKSTGARSGSSAASRDKSNSSRDSGSSDRPNRRRSRPNNEG